MTESIQKRDFAAELGALGYPKFSHLEPTTKPKPAEVLLDALGEWDLDSRVLEGLPWLAMAYIDMDWDWLVQNAKLRHRQNGLGFVVSLASELADGRNDGQSSSKLRQCLEILEKARLSGEDTFCHDSMTQAERAWVREHRSPTAVTLESPHGHECRTPFLHPVTVRPCGHASTAAVSTIKG
jgi:hypothetical protein